jgi:type VI secretion system protein ImpC
VAALGTLASHAGGPLLADAAPDVVGLASWSQAGDSADWRLDDADAQRRWQELRASPVAPWIGLAAPRPLMRLPYGKANAVQRFAFEELHPGLAHEHFLWGSAALGIAELLGLAFRRDGRSLRPGQVNDLDDLPPCVYESEGETRLQPSAETFLTVTSGEALSRLGVMPLLSYRNRHAARVMSFDSLADPPQPLPIAPSPLAPG